MGGEGKRDGKGFDLLRLRGKEYLEKARDILKKYWDYSDQEKRNNLIYPFGFFTGTLIYLEVILHLLIYQRVDNK
ncbi:MAG TPA: hypothetical protein DEP17_00105, partial [Lachnospiraceae bacterium]|nr:hypothetical protein [Lachnospiraceae bacterium]